jgi:hypothetical protein
MDCVVIGFFGFGVGWIMRIRGVIDGCHWYIFIGLVFRVVCVGALLLVGAFTCIAGISLAAVMVVAVILVKAKMGFVASEPDILLFASALGIALAGSGRYSVMRHCGCPWCKKMRGGACCNSSEGCKDCVCKDGVCALQKSEEKPAEKVM